MKTLISALLVLVTVTFSIGQDALYPGEELAKGDELTSTSGKYSLKMQEDGNLVLYGFGKAQWSSETSGKAVKKCVMQSDGNFVLYGFDNKAVWSSGTAGKANPYIKIQNDGNLVIYSRTNQWASNTTESAGTAIKYSAKAELVSGNTLEKGKSLVSENGTYKLTMQEDGNLVLYNPSNKPLWNTETSGKAVKNLAMQTDGNLVLYGFNGDAIWDSKTKSKNATLVMQNDGNLVIYGVEPVWDTNSLK